MVNLWVDNERLPPDGWEWAKTVPEAIRVMTSTPVSALSLDYDLECPKCNDHPSCECGCHDKGIRLVWWMAANNSWPMTKPIVHSANPTGALKMREVIDRFFPSPYRAGTTAP